MSDRAWRKAPGALLKRHQLFVNLLKLLKGGVASYDMLTEAFARNMPNASKGEIRQVLDALLVLMAWALRRGQSAAGDAARADVGTGAAPHGRQARGRPGRGQAA